MARISVGAAVGSGFRLVFHKPLTVLAWGLLQSLGYAAFFALYAGLATTMYGMSEASGEPTRAVGAMLMFEGGAFLVVMLITVLRVIVTTAVWRSVLHPDRKAWSYLRVGMAELFVGAVEFAVAFGGNVIVLPLMPFLFVIGGLVAAHQYVAAIVLGVVLLVVVIAVVVYLELRLALMGPMIVDDGKFHFVDAWKLTRGSVGSLFLVGLSLVGIVVAAEVVLYAVLAAAVVATMAASAGGLDHVQSVFLQSPAAMVVRLWPIAAVGAVLAIPLTGAFYAVLLAPWARAYRDLVPAAAGPDALFA